MITLGITGCFSDLPGTFLPGVPEWLFHDAAAALVIDGVVAAAVEEERLNRIKHTNKFPSLAVPQCLAAAGVRASDVDEVAFFFDEEYANLALGYEYLKFPAEEPLTARQLLIRRLAEATGRQFAEPRIHFVKHHVAHAYGAYSDSGFGESLAVVADSNGEAESVSVFYCRDRQLELLRSYPVAVSLGRLYLDVLPFMGFRRFDEYKVMGLAPYGDPSVYRGEFAKHCELLPDGQFRVDSEGVVDELLRSGVRPRRAGEAIRQQDRDIAAAVQAALEEVELHILRYWAGRTGAPRLCLSGGVAHNSSANGSVLRSGIFAEVFVHPASHDAGASAGAAQYRQAQAGGHAAGRPLRSAFLGPGLGGAAQVRDEAAHWRAFVEAVELPEGQEEGAAASAIAAGQIIGWARGRSEFGPRALGHRSILADPRQAQNRERVNSMIKKRESFRPFAPAVLAERAAEVFDLTDTTAALDFMSFVVTVRPQWQSRLPAVTHVDGSARAQLVSQRHNQSLWLLITRFCELTGVPVVLNTSFNNFAEPIVQTVRDVLRCLVTTKLDAVVLPGHLLRRRPDLTAALVASEVVLHPAAQLREVSGPGGPAARVPAPERVVTCHYTGARQMRVSEEMFGFLSRVRRAPSPLAALGAKAAEALAGELMGLWEQRFIDVLPADG